MKLFYDARYIRPVHDGISRYSTEVANALYDITRDTDVEVTFIICEDHQLEKLPKDARFIKTHDQISIKELWMPRLLNKHKPDVVFSPLHNPGVFGHKYKLVLTSHDMIYFHHRTPPLDLHGIMRPLWRLYFATLIPQRTILNQADFVVTVSESAKKEFQAAKLTKRPIVVVPNAPNQLDALLPALPDIGAQAPRNIVYMGAFIGYKNVETLIRGLEWLPGYTLHLLSKIPSESRKKELEALIPAGASVIFYNGVTDQKYAELLANNAILATASLDEGYGLPVAEALTLGVPAVITDMPVFHEVAGDGALFFDPHNPQDFADKVKQLDDAEVRVRIGQAGKQHIAQYTWEASAHKLLDGIRGLFPQK